MPEMYKRLEILQECQTVVHVLGREKIQFIQNVLLTEVQRLKNLTGDPPDDLHTRIDYARRLRDDLTSLLEIADY